ncbi:MAG: DoxX protein [Cyanobacteria bacterium J06636_16]
MTSTRKMAIGLATIRITTAAFFLVWSLEKIIAPEIAQKVFARFYASTISPSVSIALGILQTAIVLLFLAGLFKLWTYGAILGMHAVSTLSSYEPLLNPYTPPNHLFWAAVPTLGAIFALFLMRKEDQLLTFSGVIGSSSKHQKAETL